MFLNIIMEYLGVGLTLAAPQSRRDLCIMCSTRLYIVGVHVEAGGVDAVDLWVSRIRDRVYKWSTPTDPMARCCQTGGVSGSVRNIYNTLLNICYSRLASQKEIIEHRSRSPPTPLIETVLLPTTASAAQVDHPTG